MVWTYPGAISKRAETRTIPPKPAVLLTSTTNCALKIRPMAIQQAHTTGECRRPRTISGVDRHARSFALPSSASLASLTKVKLQRVLRRRSPALREAGGDITERLSLEPRTRYHHTDNPAEIDLRALYNASSRQLYQLLKLNSSRMVPGVEFAADGISRSLPAKSLPLVNVCCHRNHPS